MHIWWMVCRTMRSFPHAVITQVMRLQLRQLTLLPILLASVYLAYYYNVWEYINATPFTYFQYPLETDIEAVVDNVMNRRMPGVQPLDSIKIPYVLNSERKCRNEDGEEENIYLLMIIKSSIYNFEQRNIIRRTWARENYDANFQIRRIFVMGVIPTDRLLQHRVGMESQDWDDIVQLYFEDTYHNNTRKLVAGFDWAATFCRSARFLGFFDDDFYVSVHNVIRMLGAIQEQDQWNVMIGYIWKHAMPFRTRSSKWYVSLEEYPYRHWPPYPTGGAFFVPMETAQRMYVAMQYIKLFRFDDVYMGIVAWKLKVNLIHNDHIHFYEFPYDRFKYRSVIAVHGFKDADFLYKVWKEQEEDRKDREKLHIV